MYIIYGRPYGWEASQVLLLQKEECAKRFSHTERGKGINIPPILRGVEAVLPSLEGVGETRYFFNFLGTKREKPGPRNKKQ